MELRLAGTLCRPATRLEIIPVGSGPLLTGIAGRQPDLISKRKFSAETAPAGERARCQASPQPGLTADGAGFDGSLQTRSLGSLEVALHHPNGLFMNLDARDDEIFGFSVSLGSGNFPRGLQISQDLLVCLDKMFDHFLCR